MWIIFSNVCFVYITRAIFRINIKYIPLYVFVYFYACSELCVKCEIREFCYFMTYTIVCTIIFFTWYISNIYSWNISWEIVSRNLIYILKFCFTDGVIYISSKFINDNVCNQSKYRKRLNIFQKCVYVDLVSFKIVICWRKDMKNENWNSAYKVGTF